MQRNVVIAAGRPIPVKPSTEGMCLETSARRVKSWMTTLWISLEGGLLKEIDHPIAQRERYPGLTFRSVTGEAMPLLDLKNFNNGKS